MGAGSRYVLLFVIGSLLMSTPACAAALTQRDIEHAAKLEQFLRAYASGDDTPKDTAVRYFAAKIPGSNMIIAYLDGRYLCGTSGCSSLILRPSGRSYKILGDIGAHRPPIRLLSTKHYGMPDFSVWVQGGGLQPGYQATVQFDGKEYGNPTAPPSRKISDRLGQTLIPRHAKLKRLYR